LTIAGCISRTIGIGPTMGSCVEGAIPLAVVGLNRRTNAFVMCGSSALGHGGTSATAMRCWHFAAPSITVPSIGYLNAIDSDFERRKNHRMLLFDGTTLQETLNEGGWYYGCRTAQSTVATWEGETFRLDTLGACSKPGTLMALQEGQMTRDAYGPVMLLCCWATGYQAPLYLVSNMDAAEEACRYDQKRFRIETFFSDQKSRGFHIHKSHIADPQRLSRLLIAACLAYIWMVY
jgi:hypothetical protein